MSEIKQFVDEIETPPLEEWVILDIKNRMLELGAASSQLGFIAAPPSDLYSEILMLGNMQKFRELHDGRIAACLKSPKEQQSVKPKEFRNQSSSDVIGKSSRSERNQVFSTPTKFEREKETRQRQHHAMHSHKFSYAQAVTEKEDTEIKLAQTHFKEGSFNSELYKFKPEVEDNMVMQMNTNGIKMEDAIVRRLSQNDLDEYVILEETNIIQNKTTPQSTNGEMQMSLANITQEQVSKNDVFPQSQDLISKETKSEDQIERKAWNDTGIGTVHKSAECTSQKDFDNKDCENCNDNIDLENEVNWQDDTHKVNGNAVENSYKIKYETKEVTTAKEIAKSNQLKMRSISENETVGVVHYQSGKDTCTSIVENENEANERCDNGGTRQDEYYIVSIENTFKLHGENSRCYKNSMLDKVSHQVNKENTKEIKELGIDDKPEEVNFKTKFNENTNVLYSNYANCNNVSNNDDHKHQREHKDKRTMAEVNKEATTPFADFEQLIAVSHPEAFHERKLNGTSNTEETQNTKDYSDSNDIEEYVFVDPYRDLSDNPSAVSHSLFQRVGKMASALFTSISSAKGSKRQMEQSTNTMENFEGNSKLEHLQNQCLDDTSNLCEKSLASVCKDDDIVTFNENSKVNISNNKMSSEISLEIEKNLEKIVDKETATMIEREVHVPYNVVKDTSETKWQLQSAEIINSRSKLVKDDKFSRSKTEENIVKENKESEHNMVKDTFGTTWQLQSAEIINSRSKLVKDDEFSRSKTEENIVKENKESEHNMVKDTFGTTWQLQSAEIINSRSKLVKDDEFSRSKTEENIVKENKESEHNMVKDTFGTTWQLQSAEIINNRSKLVKDDKFSRSKTEENIVKENKESEHNMVKDTFGATWQLQSAELINNRSKLVKDDKFSGRKTEGNIVKENKESEHNMVKDTFGATWQLQSAEIINNRSKLVKDDKFSERKTEGNIVKENKESEHNMVKDTFVTTRQLQSAEKVISNRSKLVNDDKSNGRKTEGNIVKENKKPEHNDTDHNKQEFNENPIELTLVKECELELQNNIGTVVKKENKAYSAGNSTSINTNEVKQKKDITNRKENKEYLSTFLEDSKKIIDEAKNIERSTKRVINRKHKLNRMTSLELFSALVDDIVPPSTCSNSIKVMIMHSDEDSDLATEMVERLRKEFNFRAAAECQISILRTMSPYSYQKGAMNWADIIVPIITNTWLDDISNIVSSNSRSQSSLSARQGYMILRNKMMNGVNYDWHVVCAVMEGTDQRYRHWPEFFNAIPIWKQFRKLGKTITDVHNLPRFIN